MLAGLGGGDAAVRPPPLRPRIPLAVFACLRSVSRACVCVAAAGAGPWVNVHAREKEVSACW